jgi:Ulp1 family protease
LSFLCIGSILSLQSLAPENAKFGVWRDLPRQNRWSLKTFPHADHGVHRRTLCMCTFFFTQLWTTYTQPDHSTSDFLTRGGGQSWLRASGEQMDKTPLDCDLFDLIVLFIPVHLGQHWVSIEVHFLTCRIVYMDSFNNNGTDKMNCVFHFLNFMHQQRDGPDSGPLEKQNWSFEHDLVDPQQNASDCGVYQGIRAILSTDPFVQENRFPCVGRRFHFKHTDVSLTSMMHRVVFGWLN